MHIHGCSSSQSSQMRQQLSTRLSLAEETSYRLCIVCVATAPQNCHAAYDAVGNRCDAMPAKATTGSSFVHCMQTQPQPSLSANMTTAAGISYPSCRTQNDSIVLRAHGVFIKVSYMLHDTRLQQAVRAYAVTTSVSQLRCRRSRKQNFLWAHDLSVKVLG